MQKHIVVINTSVLTDTGKYIWKGNLNLREEAIKNLNTNRN